MTSSKRNIVVGLAAIVLGACGSSDPGAKEDGPIAESASAVSQWSWQRDGFSDSCFDLCDNSTCSCIRASCSIGIVGQACSSAYATCEAISGGSLIELECLPTSPPPPPPPPTYVWKAESGGYAHNCADQCGQPSCSCVPDQCSPSLEGQACDTPGAECNAVDGPDYEILQCTTQ